MPLAWHGLTLAELLIGHQIRTDLPQPKANYIPTWTNIQKRNTSPCKDYSKQHRVKTLPSLPDNTPVWIQTDNSQVPGTVVHQATTPRSYVV